ncbi:hypothetical protein [Caldicoprobacter faecalis]|uniref:Uncharacterized protein n=1 Tax=Caldicoprobacter faecalis TaxID=937334 RepID=A0A1I5YFW2_9FIRM|nr:hypothetical protein [Caldicoprobacter faecalis]SFQ43010.1 hypothetical protein SAMN05444406_1451 [Caldicoprobacter faecalis]
MKRVTIMVFAFLTLLMQLGSDNFSVAHADDDNGIVMEAKMGFEGRFSLGNWTPIAVDIENKGDDVQGDLEIEVQKSSS